MEQGKIAIKGRRSKGKAGKKAEELNEFKINGVNFILDDSLSKYANDPFFIEHARNVDGKGTSNKSHI